MSRGKTLYEWSVVDGWSLFQFKAFHEMEGALE